MTARTAAVARKPKIGLVAGGLGAYWPQFPDLLPHLERCARRVTERMRELDAELVDAGVVSDAGDGAAAAANLRALAGLTGLELVEVTT